VCARVNMHECVRGDVRSVNGCGVTGTHLEVLGLWVGVWLRARARACVCVCVGGCGDVRMGATGGGGVTVTHLQAGCDTLNECTSTKIRGRTIQLSTFIFHLSS
jgi:hypothetical protein